MRALLSSMAAVLLVSSLASAADVSGDIKSVDTTKNMVTLNDGTVYTAPEGVDLSKFKSGEKVNMSYDKTGDKMVITSIKPAGRP